MNVQAHMSAGWVPNQGGLPQPRKHGYSIWGRLQQNGNANQMQNLVGGVAPGAASGGVGVVPQQHNMLTMDSELLRARGSTRDRIFSILLHRQSQPIDETTRMKFRDISIRLEEGLFKAAHTKEDYMNMETLEPRLSSLINSRSGNNHTQRHQQLVNSTSSIATMTQQHNMLTMDSELLRARGSTRDRIFSILLRRQSQPINETTRMKFRDISIRLEEGLFKAAHTKEDYMNMETLEPRLSSLINSRSGNNHTQRHKQLVNSTSSIATMTLQHNMLTMDSELLRARGSTRDRIFSILLRRQSQPINETTRMKFRDISIRLEEGLFKAAHTKEDYMNMETLEPRLSSLIKSRSGNNHNQRHQQLA